LKNGHLAGSGLAASPQPARNAPQHTAPQGAKQDIRGQSHAPQEALSDNWKGTPMTSIKYMPINDFCPLPIWIPTYQDHGLNAWFILNEYVVEALALPDNFALYEKLDKAELDNKMPPYAKDKKDAWQLVSESGLYKLIFMSNAPMFQTFKNWITQVILPTAAEDGCFFMGEEKCFLPPDCSSQMTNVEPRKITWLAEEVLPEIRRDGCYAHIDLLPMFVGNLASDDPAIATAEMLKKLKGHRSRKNHRLH
jgi:prophage antirepressor-like protein